MPHFVKRGPVIAYLQKKLTPIRYEVGRDKQQVPIGGNEKEVGVDFGRAGEDAVWLFTFGAGRRHVKHMLRESYRVEKGRIGSIKSTVKSWTIALFVDWLILVIEKLKKPLGSFELLLEPVGAHRSLVCDVQSGWSQKESILIAVLRFKGQGRLPQQEHVPFTAKPFFFIREQ